MSKKIQFTIPRPCHENWDSMSPVEKGRFCSSCQKQVVDFSSMTDREVAIFFKKKSTDSVCGRFMQDQLERSIEIPKKRIPWLKYFFQFLIPAFLISCRENITGKVKVTETETAGRLENHVTLGIVLTDIELDVDTIPVPVALPDTTESITIKESYESVGDVAVDICKGMISNRPTVVKGMVVDEDDKPLLNATVNVDILSSPLITDDSGFFSFQLTPEKNIRVLRIEVSSVGYKSKETDFLLDNTALLTVRLERDFKFIDATVVVANMKSFSKGMVCVTTIRKEENIPPNNFVKELASTIKLFPNPLRSDTVLNIEFKGAGWGKYTFQLLNISGQLVFSKEIWIEKEVTLSQVPLPVITPGNYFVRMISKDSGEALTSKLIIQH